MTAPASRPSVSRRCSHVLIRVHDLPGAVDSFRAAGFQVAYATAPEHKALHAHVWFPEGPVMELLTTPPGARWMRLPVDLRFGRGAGERMVRWARQDEGFCDLALLVEHSELAAATGELAEDGVPCGRAVPWTRRRPDGGTARFAFSYPRGGRLPFLVTPYDPPQHPAGVRHPNGAQAITRVVLGVRPADLPAVRRLADDAPELLLEEAPVTGVRAVHLAGLTDPLDPALLHGAVLLPADATPVPPTTHSKGSSTS
ncbi:VOC family protein [Streptomyces sp. ISID311]|uniref:VOC family protein n=1 Tax=Streptomyces sp. ISID311 TaxID=2601673 RepID=UPI0011BD2F06|nr:VOC family protein [Streptomyces sp. ISID311]TXC99827.1 VOC family protein [Streptomyces sp. ISID311]